MTDRALDLLVNSGLAGVVLLFLGSELRALRMEIGRMHVKLAELLGDRRRAA